MTRKEELMLQALELSKDALPYCQPNPPVGCLITYHNQVISTGYTEPPGQRHAEIVAINNCSQLLSACELFVTLEPCSFFGRTPACTEALIKCRPKKIYVAMLDPDARNNGRGIQILQTAGLDVQVGLAQDAVREFLRDYLNKS
ncbi:MAG: bifunctional diaminohydroxyphosphoribosylaminopyrimidine deaminase/5-amino-6-(5-phosphoribosylamino)uracil reductase RibD [Candidatus Paceibacterota bacterium]